MNTILYIILALMVLLIMVTIHEFGHYIAGKILDFKINEFSIGFGPSIISKKCKNGEIFSIRCVPLGGYCAFEGEDESSEDSRSFEKQAPWKRIIVLIAGGLFNIISAMIFSVIVLCAVGYDVVQVGSVSTAILTTNSQEIQNEDLVESIKIDGTTTLIICEDKLNSENEYYFECLEKNGNKKYYVKMNYIVQFIYDYIGVDETRNYTYTLNKLAKIENTNQSQGDYYMLGDKIYSKDLTTQKISLERILNNELQVGDVIYKVNGKRVGVTLNRQVTTMISNAAQNGELTLTVKRGNKMQDILTYGHTYTYFDSNNNMQTSSGIGISIATYRYGFIEALGRSLSFTAEICLLVLEVLGQLIIGKVSLSTVGGPITTIATIAGYSQKNIASILILLPLIAGNLGVFNLLPIPALDGSKVVFCIIEWIRKKPIDKKIENNIHTIGFFVLMGLVLMADLYQVFFANIFKTLFG